jgi:hypothetical protein
MAMASLRYLVVQELFAIWSCKNWIVAFFNASCTKSPGSAGVGQNDRAR